MECAIGVLLWQGDAVGISDLSLTEVETNACGGFAEECEDGGAWIAEAINHDLVALLPKLLDKAQELEGRGLSGSGNGLVKMGVVGEELGGWRFTK